MLIPTLPIPTLPIPTLLGRPGGAPGFVEIVSHAQWQGRMDEASLTAVLTELGMAADDLRAGVLASARQRYLALLEFGMQAASIPLEVSSAAGLAACESADDRPRAALGWIDLALDQAQVFYDEPVFASWLRWVRIERERVLADIAPRTAAAHVTALVEHEEWDTVQRAMLLAVRAAATAAHDPARAWPDATEAVRLLTPVNVPKLLEAALVVQNLAAPDPESAELAQIRATRVAHERAGREIAARPQPTPPSAADREVLRRRLTGLFGDEPADGKPAADRSTLAARLRREWDAAIAARDEAACAVMASSVATLSAEAGDLPAARRYAQSARELAASCGWPRQEGVAILLLARLASAGPGRLSTSATYPLSLVRWLDELREPDEPSLSADGWLDRLDAAAAERRRADRLAEAALVRAVETVDQLRQPDLLTSHAAELVRFLGRHDRTAEASRFADRIRDELEPYLQAAGKRPAAAVSADLLHAELELAQGHRGEEVLKVLVDACTWNGSAPPGPHHLARCSVAAELALEMGHTDLAFALLERGRTGRDAVSMEDLRAALSPGHRLVEFMVGASSLWCLRITADAVLADRICRTDDAAWAAFREQIEEQNTARQLTDPMMRRISAYVVGSGHTTVVPHGPLHNTPLHLDLAADAGPRPATGTCVYAPSATVATRARQHMNAAGRAVVLGDPLGDLPWARQEAELISGLFGVGCHLGKKVNLATLRQRLSEPGPVRLVHLAAHAVFDAIRPERSGIRVRGADWHELTEQERLAQAWRALDDDTAVITATELSELPLDGALVVVNACESGRQLVAVGDQLFGVTSALLHAGAGAVLTSLWPVDDQAAATILVATMRRLVPIPWTLLAVESALSAAQDEYRRAAADGRAEGLARDLGLHPAGLAAAPAVPMLDDPAAWAPFVLVGGVQ